MQRSKVQATNAPRALYNELLDQYPVSSNNPNEKVYPNRIITDSYLRLETSIQGTISVIQFNMLTNQGSGTQNVTENRLQITDRFVASGISILIMKAGATVAATQAEISLARPHTFNNNEVFVGANEAANLEVIYNANMKITVDSTTWIQSLDTRRFFRVPTSQQGIAVSSVATTGVLGADGWDSANYPFAPLTPTITFSGIGKNEIVVSLPNPTSLIGTTSQNFAICWIRGYLVQNVNQGR